MANEKKELIWEMKLHGQFEKETEEMKTEMSRYWLTKGDLKSETESLLIAAQVNPDRYWTMHKYCSFNTL